MIDSKARRLISICTVMLFIITGSVSGLGGTDSSFLKTISYESYAYTEPLSLTDWWPMYQHDPQNSGNSSSGAPETNSVLWTFFSEANVFSASIADGKIFFGTDKTDSPIHSNSFVYCLTLYGKEIWKFLATESLDSTPAFSDNQVYIGGGQGTMYCLNANNGSCIWTFETDDGKLSSPIIMDNKVFIGSINGNIFCFDCVSGDLVWRTKIGIGVRCTPAIVDQKLFIGNYCIDILDGTILWRADIQIPLLSSPTIYNDTVYSGSIDELMYCYNVDTGDTVWDHYIGSMVWESSPASAYGYIYVCNAFGYVYCLDSNDGHEVWTEKKSCRAVGSPVVSDGKVYVGSTDGNIYCFDAFNGESIWFYETVNPFVSSPAIAYGHLIIGSGNTMYCFGEDFHVSSDLECDGTVSLINVEPNSIVNSNFTVRNIGKTDSRLDWMIESYPDWGNWTFFPKNGSDLEVDDVVTVGISIQVPDTKNTLFQGSIKVVNIYDASDFEMIDISLKTSKLRWPVFLQTLHSTLQKQGFLRMTFGC